MFYTNVLDMHGAMFREYKHLLYTFSLLQVSNFAIKPVSKGIKDNSQNIILLTTEKMYMILQDNLSVTL